ncbi:hypothetical protein ACDH70_04415 [Xanthomonas axonopodis pv. poinsettiicola]|uniref:hypothetical protein n=1 Tax=Xanthomonas TaxID=338 RepID=UPI001E3F7E9D|nr:hypothetical protein [Xanthomonas codiaei]MCC8538749.1 hypothetical protein [Xanthomonas codiaei]
MKLLRGFLFLFLVISSQAWAQSPKIKAITPFDEVVATAGIENGLRAVLNGQYAPFKENFDEVGNPTQLKDGGILIDGWKTGRPATDAAAFVYYPDGRVYAAYYTATGGRIRYFSSDNGKIHIAIQAWAKRFAPQFEVERKAMSALSGSRNSVLASAADPNAAEQAEMRKVAASIWGQSLADGWDMNAAVGDILGTVTKEIMECSEAYSLVPKPVGWIPGWSYVAKTALQIVTYVAGVHKDRRYKVCVDSAALNWRTPIEAASLGI